jgi:hypothetical protein
MTAITDNLATFGFNNQPSVAVISSPSNPDVDQRPRVEAPRNGQPLANFARELGHIMANNSIWFVHNDTVVQINRKRLTETVETTVFHPITAVEMRTAIEQYIRIGRHVNEMFREESISRETAAAVLASQQFKEQLPTIYRILDVPIPFLHQGAIVYASKGYDHRFNSFCPETSPEIHELNLSEAKELLCELHRDFPLTGPLSITLSIARLLTPFCKGLIQFARTPIWMFEANRPRSGKDYLAGCTGIIYQGQANEDSPLDPEAAETRKRITAALLSGRRFMHFANCEGYIRNNAIEQIATAPLFSGRRLGSNDADSDLILANEIEFSLSANTGFEYSEDLNLRSRKITLEYYEEDGNARRFTRPDLHGWIRQNRSRFLGAMAALVKEWDRVGRPPGSTPFSSFPKWAETVGGIMVACGLGDPCASQSNTGLTGDSLTEQMKLLFVAAFDSYGDAFINKHDLLGIIHTHDLFGFWDLAQNKGHQSTFGKKIRAFENRILGGIQMNIDHSDKTRPKFRFSRSVTTRNTTLLSETLKGNNQICEPCEPCGPPALQSTDKSITIKGVPEVRNVHNVRIHCQTSAETQSTVAGEETVTISNNAIPACPIIVASVTNDKGMESI